LPLSLSLSFERELGAGGRAKGDRRYWPEQLRVADARNVPLPHSTVTPHSQQWRSNSPWVPPKETSLR
jgi:hypothetical protein